MENPECVCGLCGKTRIIMIPMDSGRLESPYVLCSKCWVEGLTTPRKPSPEKRATVVDAEMGDALRKSGWKVDPATHAENARPRKLKTPKREAQ